ncbi:hypothetical protein O6H91_03G022800 [Diphasiastrum complanatum]|uniref:Uncharacterized protein n=1 Tax=Diphasiastrum complanatum TaxID=34168 RepID=A0ACC2E496_DIPCM|nr:hypothetical protein O6H91_03G022800 [Diphasiastrum complanatum]
MDVSCCCLSRFNSRRKVLDTPARSSDSSLTPVTECPKNRRRCNTCMCKNCQAIVMWDDSASFEALKSAQARGSKCQTGHRIDALMWAADLCIDKIDWEFRTKKYVPDSANALQDDLVAWYNAWTDLEKTNLALPLSIFDIPKQNTVHLSAEDIGDTEVHGQVS